MTLVSRYVGQFVTAQSASDFIDIDKIYSGCEKLETTSDGFDLIFNKMENIAFDNRESTLCFNDKTIGSLVDNNSQIFTDCSNDIKDVAQNIRVAAENAYNEIQRQLNDTARSQDLNAINDSNR